MGYKGEKASLNQYSLLKEYLVESGAVDQIRRVNHLTEAFQKRLNAHRLSAAELVATDSTVGAYDVIAFDAGMARFFVDSPNEMVVLKIAGGTDENLAARYSGLVMPTYSHIFTGLVKNPRVFASITKRADATGASALAAEEIGRLFETGILKELNLLMNELFDGSFWGEIKEWLLKSTKPIEVDNLARELAEWYYILRAAKATNGKDLLIVKDGSLITNQLGSGVALASRLYDLFKVGKNTTSPLIVGVVKESRFIKNEGHIVSRVIHNYARSVKGNCFFKIPRELEQLLDATPEVNKSVERIFLSIASGKSVYEVQIPMTIVTNGEAYNKVRATVLSQVTGLYGGSIAANSLAHRAASLSEAEATALEKEIKLLAGVK
jgi:hypothetical protein